MRKPKELHKDSLVENYSLEEDSEKVFSQLQTDSKINIQTFKEISSNLNLDDSLTNYFFQSQETLSFTDFKLK